MKTFYLIPLLFLSACSTAPKLVLRPQQPPVTTDNSAVRYPEVVRAYHFGRYVNPNDDLVMHEQHVVYRVEENTRWNFHPGPVGGNVPALPARDAAFVPAPVNDAILAEVNSQKLATVQIMLEASVLSAALRATVSDMKQRLDALEGPQGRPASLSTTNEPADALSP